MALFFSAALQSASKIDPFSPSSQERTMTERLAGRVFVIMLWLGAVMLPAGPAAAQTVTTGTLSGIASDQQGGALPGTAISAVHQPTGTIYEAITGADGQFQILNVRVGGPYTVTATLSGFRDETQNDVFVALGENRPVTFRMQLASVTESVTVTADVIINPTRAGTAANISRETIESLPTLQRSLFDFARTSPFVNLNASSAGSDSSISVAGRNNRYNNMQIDGAVNNDVFGIPDAGVPGGQTGSQPISLDAIQEIQIVVSPYDVRQGGFSGGSVNAVTKSGANTISGTAYWFARNQNLVGKIPGIATPAVPDPSDTKLGQFKDQQGGFSIGGPLLRNKAFFFVNLDFGRAKKPVGFSADGTSGQNWGGGAHLAEVQEALSILKNQYGFDAGGLSEVSTPTDNNKYFTRVDVNLSRHNQLTLRNNYIDGSRLTTSSGQPSNIIYPLPSAYYTAEETVLSPVVQLNTTFTNAYNEFRVAYTRDRFERVVPTPTFPYVRIDFADSLNIRVGTENSSQANQLDQDIIELTDDVTMVRGKHTFTIGTHNEFFKFTNVFIQNLFGNYEFFNGPASDPLANLRAGLAQIYNVQFSNTSNPRQPAEFSVRQFGGYAGDQWRVRSNLTLTYGVRFDAPQFPDKPRANPVTVADFGLSTDVVPAPKMWSPRIGFNWDLSGGGARQSQVRGGIGYFTGRTPYVWMSNQYGNTGVDYTSIATNNSAANRIPFVADPNNQPKTVTGGSPGRATINLVDPDYKYPAIVRGNLGYDRSLFGGLVTTGEWLFTRNVKEITYQNINYARSGMLPDRRFTFTKVDANLNDVMLLTNTARGYSWSVSGKIERPFRNGWQASASYLYNSAKSVNDGTSSIATSNWANNPIRYDTNDPGLARSVYSVGSRLNVAASIPIPLGKGIRSTASFFYNGQQGRPYVIMFNGDPNGDNRTNNDIAFIPASPDQAVLINGTWEQLDAFLSSDPASKDHRGEVPERNTGRAPWFNQLDFRYAVNVPTGSKARVELTMDVFNLLNLLNKDWGWQYFPLFPSSSANGLLGYGGVDLATGKEILNLSTIASRTFQGTFQRDDLRSRWQAQWGLRVRF
jgi:hypothetical protein